MNWFGNNECRKCRGVEKKEEMTEEKWVKEIENKRRKMKGETTIVVIIEIDRFRNCISRGIRMVE